MMSIKGESEIECINEEVNPLISVALPVYNGEKYLAAALNSILEQSYINFEVIIVDDGSVDSSLEILKAYEARDNRIKVISRANKGNPASLNEAIDNSRGKFIIRMDQDDICLPNRFSQQVDYMLKHPDIHAMGSAAKFIDADGNFICTYTPINDDQSLRDSLPQSPFVHPTVILSKEAFYRAGKYNEKMKWGGEDVVLFEKISRQGKLHNLTEPLLCYRLVPGSLSRKPPEFRRMLTEIVVDEISGKSVEDRRFDALQEVAKKIDKSEAIFDYYFELAKLNAWSGGSRRKSFIFLEKCRAIKPLSIKLYFLYIGGIFSNTLVKWAYRILKKKKYTQRYEDNK